MSKFLITGGAGFIGSNLAEALCARGNAVAVLDNFATGKRENLLHLEGRIELVEGSITDLDTCRKAAEGADFVLHQAALASVPRSLEDPLGTNETNVTGTLHMLVAARDAGVKRFVYAASSSAYGDAAVERKSEDLPARPLSPYAIQKHAGELYCEAFHRLFGLQTVALRYFNVFGPRQDPASTYAAVVPRFITAVLRGEAPTIFGDGEQARDFTHVDNVVHANLRACEAPDTAAGGVFNVACGTQTSVITLARRIMALLGTELPVEFLPARAGDVRDSLADLTKSQSILGYRPEVAFEQGLARTLAWFQDQLNADTRVGKASCG